MRFGWRPIVESCAVSFGTGATLTMGEAIGLARSVWSLCRTCWVNGDVQMRDQNAAQSLRHIQLHVEYMAQSE